MQLADALEACHQEYCSEMSRPVIDETAIMQEGDAIVKSEAYKTILSLVTEEPSEPIGIVLLVAIRFGMRVQRKLDRAGTSVRHETEETTEGN